VAALAVGAAAALAGPAHASGVGGLPAGASGAREVMLVANGEGGTVSLVDARTFVLLRELDVLPDGPDAGLGDNPTQALLGQQVVEAAGGSNYAQDQDVSPDGRTLYVSRGHRGDVAAFDVTTGRLVWKLAIPGVRSDHMTISHDGGRLYVSALTMDEVEVVDTERRTIVASLPTGQWPHDSHLSADGAHLYNGSIGNVITPPESRAEEPMSPYRLTVFDTASLAMTRSYDFSAGVRPFVITHDETRMYAQLSELHGVVEVDLASGALRTRELPVAAGVTDADYDFEAPHHGLAMTADEQTLCLAARASDYVALVSTKDLSARAIVPVGDAPGWTAIAPDGRTCFVANTRADTLSAISLAQGREVERLKVGDGPKQIEAVRLPQSVVCVRRDVPGCAPRLRLARGCERGRPVARLTGEVDAVRWAVFRFGGRAVGRDSAAPFERRFGRGSAGKRVVAVASVTRGPEPRVKRAARLPRCG
jgi:DNA-binding beta-propeller fold protein YncE